MQNFLNSHLDVTVYNDDWIKFADTNDMYVNTEVVEIDINAKIHPIGAKLFAKSGINLILKIKLQIEAIPINPKQPRAIKDEGT